MPRVLFTPDEMRATAGTQLAAARDLTAIGGRIAIDAATLMPPATAADVISTIARVEARLAGVAARHVDQSVELIRRAFAADLADGDLQWLLKASGDQIVDAGFLLNDLLVSRGQRRYFSNGRFNLLKWGLGGHRWGYRNGLKSMLRRDLRTLQSLANGGRAAVGRVMSGVVRGGAAAVRGVGSWFKGLYSDVRGFAKAVGKSRFGPATKLLGKVVQKAAIPWGLWENYHKSKATSWIGKVTSSIIGTAVTTVPIVALADIASDGGITATMDILVSSGESAVAQDGSYTRSMQAASDGGYGRFWNDYANLW